MIIFVCTGNTCRSPLAESYAKIKLSSEVQSRGLFVTPGSKVSDESLQLIEMNELSSPSEPQQLTHEDLQDSTLYTMTAQHKDMILQINPNANVLMLSEIIGVENDVLDPYGQSFVAYEKAFEQIKHYIDHIDL